MTIPPAHLMDPWFHECLAQAVAHPELVREYDRLRGSNLSMKGDGLALMIDKATGRIEHEIGGFVEFVHDAIYLRCPRP